MAKTKTDEQSEYMYHRDILIRRTLGESYFYLFVDCKISFTLGKDNPYGGTNPPRFTSVDSAISFIDLHHTRICSESRTARVF